jgi:hypothetical protein
MVEDREDREKNYKGMVGIRQSWWKTGRKRDKFREG